MKERGRMSSLRVTSEHTTAEAIELMTDHEDDRVIVVDRDTKQVLGRMSRRTLVERCVRAWHEPGRCRLSNHLGERRSE